MIIILYRNDLIGQIPLYLFNNTPSLTYIDFANNSLSGPIPHSVTSLPMLEFLAVEYNQLSGKVPQAMYNMSRLQSISLAAYNGKLTGMLPSNQSFSLPMLQYINLANNNFYGWIPSGLASCQDLYAISLSGNSFVDVVPTWFAKLPNLETLSMGENNIIGSIPAVLSNITSLFWLELDVNNLTGEIPPELGLLPELWRLHLGDNQLMGKIPTSLGNLSKLAYLYLGDNQLSGQVPTTLGNNAALNDLKLTTNNLDGNIDFMSALSKCRQLRYLNIEYNSFTGILHHHMRNLTSGLRTFYSGHNMLTGGLPVAISNISSLEMINIPNNLLTDPIPESIVMLENLI